MLADSRMPDEKGVNISPNLQFGVGDDLNDDWKLESWSEKINL